MEIPQKRAQKAHKSPIHAGLWACVRSTLCGFCVVKSYATREAVGGFRSLRRFTVGVRLWLIVFLGAFAPPRSFATSLFVIISLRTEKSRKRLRSRMTRRRDSRSGLRYCNMRGLLPLLLKFYHDFFLLSRNFPKAAHFRHFA